MQTRTRAVFDGGEVAALVTHLGHKPGDDMESGHQLLDFLADVFQKTG